MKTIQEMAHEAGAIHIHERPKEFAIVGNEAITRFAALVREDAWAEGYKQGIDDERISEASIGIAGGKFKVNPARENPYCARSNT